MALVLLGLAPDIAVWAYDILVEHLGAIPSEAEYFVDVQRRGCEEFRFQGSAGFGGKLYHDSWRGLRVDCYPEDRNPERDAAIARANKALAVLYPYAREGGFVLEGAL
jgi:hypothetical protein